MKILPLLDLTAPGVILGNHGIYLPVEQIKIPFQWGGRALKRTRPAEESTPIWDSLADEISILRALADRGMAPPIGQVVYFEVVRSTFPGAWHEDPVGAWGYEMADARTLAPGRFRIEAMRDLPIEGSPGAWGDVGKPDNTINGYLVDVRRTVWDRLRWAGPPQALWGELNQVHPIQLPGTVDYARNPARLAAKVHHDAQFPAGERELAYQDFWAYGQLQAGERRVVDRAAAMGFLPARGEAVLDIGCQTGGFLQYAALTAYPDGGAAAASAGGHDVYVRTGGEGGRLAGIDVVDSYLDCARLLARSCGQNICFRKLDAAAETDALLAWVRAYFPGGVEHLLLLSMEKHLGESKLFELIDRIAARHTYIETNAVAKDGGAGSEPMGPMKLWPEIESRGGRHVGNSRDRNLRRLYRIDR